MNIQDYTWKTEKDCDKVIARPVNQFDDEREWYDFEKYSRYHTYECIGIPSGQTIDGKELELVEVGSWDSINDEPTKSYVICPKAQPIEDKKETLYLETEPIGKFNRSKFIETIVQKTLEYVAEHAGYTENRFGDDILDRESILFMKEDILKEINE